MGQLEHGTVICNNPMLYQDYPDADVIRVGDTYYMISTTMHFMPGGVILHSYDLANWETAAYVYDELERTPGQMLTDGVGIYGKGMWAATLRYHEGHFYVLFVANDTGKTYLFIAEDITGPWERRELQGFYHDASLLFDDDGRVYIVYGNRHIWLTELDAELTGPKPGGLHRLILSDGDDVRLGYEGAHLYKLDGWYYLFFIHWYKDDRRPKIGEVYPAGLQESESADVEPRDGAPHALPGVRTQACFFSDSLEGTFVGGDVLADNLGFFRMGVAQGGIVDTPDGEWYSILFQDHGAIGRIPVLVPITLVPGQMPSFGDNGVVPLTVNCRSTKPDYEYAPLWGNDLRAEYWQWNHIPELSLVHRPEGGESLTIETDVVVNELTKARNVLTQRLTGPVTTVTVSVDASELQDGDYCGICGLQYEYAHLAVTRRSGALYVVLQKKVILPEPPEGAIVAEKRRDGQYACVVETAREPLGGSSAILQMRGDFTDMRDVLTFAWGESANGDDPGEGMPGVVLGESMPELKAIGGEHKVHFRLEHFTGCRVGLFVMSTEKAGGRGRISDVRYEAQ